MNAKTIAAAVLVAGLIGLGVSALGRQDAPITQPESERASGEPAITPGLATAAAEKPGPPDAQAEAASWLAALADKSKADGEEAVARLQGALRAGGLSTTTLLAIAFLPKGDDALEALRGAVLRRLGERDRAGNLKIDLSAHLRDFLERALAGDAHEQEVATRLAVITGGPRGIPSIDPDAKRPRLLTAADMALVERLLRSDEVSSRLKRAVIMVLSDMGPAAAALTPLVVHYVDEANERFRHGEAMWHAANPGSIRMVNRRDPAFDAGSALGRIGPSILPHLTALLAEEGFSRDVLVEWALRGLGNDALPALRSLAAHSNATVRKRALSVLGDRTLADESLVDNLRRATRDPDPQVRRAAAEGLVAQGDAAVADVAAALRSGDAALVRGVLWGLYARSEPVPAALHEPLRERMRSADPHETDLLAKAAKEMGPAAASATPALLRIIRDHPHMISPEPKELIRALGPGAEPHLLAALAGDDEDLRRGAARGLLWLPELTGDTQRALADWLETHEASPHRTRIAAAIAASGHPAAVEALSWAVAIGPFEERTAAAEGLGRMGRAGLPYLHKLAQLLVDLEAEYVRRKRYWPPRFKLGVIVDEAIRRVGATDLDAMFDLLDHEVWDAAAPAFDALEIAETAGLAVIARRWPGASHRQRSRVVKLLGASADAVVAHEALLREALDKGHAWVFAAGALLRHGTDAALRRACAVRLADHFAASGWQEASAALIVLRDTGTQYKASRGAVVLDALRAHWDHDDPEIRKVIGETVHTIEGAEPRTP